MSAGISSLHPRRLIGLFAVVGTLIGSGALAAQNVGTITGQVINSASNQPLASAQVSIPSLNLGALTQQNGRFIILNVPSGSHTLSVQRIGFREVSDAVTVVAGESVNRNFSLQEEALALDEIIVTGTPGGTQRRAIGNSVASVEVAEITSQVAITNMQDLLSGRTPGLQFSRLSGNVGTGSPIRIRGAKSFSLTSNPLIYVDGVRVNNSSRAGPRLGTSVASDGGETGSGEVNVLDDFNPEDIESIEIIKGPAAATLYGTEAAAGVIQIITKKGLSGAPQFNASIRQGTNFLIDPSGKLGTMYGCRTANTVPCVTPDDMFEYNMYDEANKYIHGEVPGPDGGLYFPWPTENLYQYGHAQGYNLDMRGGTDIIRYFLSGNWEREEGAEWFNSDQTARLRGNVTVILPGNLSIDVNTGYVDGGTRFGVPVVSDGGLWQDLSWSNGFCLLRINPDACTRLGGFQEHLPSDVANVNATRDYSRFTGSTTLNHAIGEWFTHRAVFGLDKGWDINEVIFPLETPPSVYTEGADGQINYDKPVSTNVSLDYAATARWDATDRLGTATSAGVQYYTKEYDYFGLIGHGFLTNSSTTVNQTPAARAEILYDFVENKSLGFYFQEELAWNDRIYLTGAARFDDNSAFGADFDAQIYPKVSATWVISEEDFFRINPVNSLRLRGAWGQAGRQPNAFAGVNLYQAISGLGGTSALAPATPGNSEVGPEVSTELELGFDLALLDDRLSTEFTYYSQKTEDALIGIGIAPSIGFPGSVDQNIGRIDNWGWEATLNARVIERSSWGFDVDFAGDHTMNEIKDLGDFPGTTAIRLGYPFPAQFSDRVVVSADYDPTGQYRDASGNAIAAVCDLGLPTGPTAQHGVALGGERGSCVPEPDIMVGPGFATYTFSVAPTLTLFNNALQVYGMAEGQYGRVGLDNGTEWGHIYNNSLVSRTENDPLWVAKDRSGDDYAKRIFDADFWKLREVGLRYSLPSSWVDRFGGDRASFAVSGRNLWTIWQTQEEIFGAPVTDPEYGTPTIDANNNFWVMPPIANVNATLRVSF